MTKSSLSPCRKNNSSARNWRGLFPNAAALMLLGCLTVAAQTPASPASPAADGDQPLQPAPPGDDFPLFPLGPGRDLVLRTCSKCHELDKIANQQFDQAGWKRMVDDMAGQGASASEEEFSQIVRYLAKAFPATK